MNRIVLAWIAFLIGSIDTAYSIGSVTGKRLLVTRKDAPVVCVENAIQASVAHNGNFTRQAFVDFVERHSNDTINVMEFQDLDIALVHIYWQTICSYDAETCITTDEVPVEKLVQTTSREGIPLIGEMCNRINLYLFGSLLTFSPTVSPTWSPSLEPTVAPSVIPSRLPTVSPSTGPSLYPTKLPSKVPSKLPSFEPTVLPSNGPTLTTSDVPSILPSRQPSSLPSVDPTFQPTQVPTFTPSRVPTIKPSQSPTIKRSQAPTTKSSQAPTRTESMIPSMSQYPSVMPSARFSSNPSQSPTQTSSQEPSDLPSGEPSAIPSFSSIPSIQPSWGESFTLTFSMEVVKDPNTRMTLSDALTICIRNGFMKQLVNLDEACSRNDEQCPYSWQTSVDLTPYQCFEGIDASNNQCTLADFTVAIRSYEMSLEEYEVLKSNLSNAMKGYIREELESCIRENMYGG